MKAVHGALRGWPIDTLEKTTTLRYRRVGCGTRRNHLTSSSLSTVDEYYVAIILHMWFQENDLHNTQTW